jgi:hypothetical protein
MAKQTGRKAAKPAMSEAEKAAAKQRLKDETKADRFIRLAVGDGTNGRIPKLLKAIDSLTRLATGKSEYTPQQVQQMLGAVGDACERMKNAFTGVKGGGGGFRF